MANFQLDDKYLAYAFAKQMKDYEVEESWNPCNQAIVEDLRGKVKTCSVRHERSRRYYNTVHKMIMYPTILFTTLNAVVGYENSCEDDMRSRIMIATTSSISIISAIMLSYVKFMGIAEKVEAHMRSAKQYEILYRKVNTELQRPKDERNDAENVIRDASREFDDLLISSPSIPRSIVKDVPLIETCPTDDNDKTSDGLIKKIKQLLSKTHPKEEPGVV